jgi:uncharacterized protein YxjI
MARGDRRQGTRGGGPGGGGTSAVYRMREGILSDGGAYWIEDSRGDRVFRVDGAALRQRHTVDLEDAHGTRLLRVETRVPHRRDTMGVARPDGSPAATIHKPLVSPLRARWRVEVEDGPAMSLQGNVFDHEYGIEQDEGRVAEVSRRWFGPRDTFGVQVAPHGDVPLVIAVALALDLRNHRAC